MSSCVLSKLLSTDMPPPAEELKVARMGAWGLSGVGRGALRCRRRCCGIRTTVSVAADSRQAQAAAAGIMLKSRPTPKRLLSRLVVEGKVVAAVGPLADRSCE